MVYGVILLFVGIFLFLYNGLLKYEGRERTRLAQKSTGFFENVFRIFKNKIIGDFYFLFGVRNRKYSLLIEIKKRKNE